MMIFKKLKIFLLNRTLFIIIFFSLSFNKVYSYSVNRDTTSFKSTKILYRDPTRAGLYSAILPGLGQFYNKQYWKIPLAWGLVGGFAYGIYINSVEYNKVRTEYKRRINGYKPDYLAFADNNRLLNHLRDVESNRDMFVLYTILGYVINILDANVSAHLSEFNVDNVAVIKPNINPSKNYIGLSINFKL